MNELQQHIYTLLLFPNNMTTRLLIRHTFDLHEDDVFACMVSVNIWLYYILLPSINVSKTIALQADIGWITGHSYSVYGE